MTRTNRHLLTMTVTVTFHEPKQQLVATVDSDSLDRWVQLCSYIVLSKGCAPATPAGPRSIPGILQDYPGQLTELTIKVVGTRSVETNTQPGIIITGLGRGGSHINLATARSLLTKLMAACAVQGTRVRLSETAHVPARPTGATNTARRFAPRRRINRRRQPRSR